MRSVWQLIEPGQRGRWALVLAVALFGSLLEVVAGSAVLTLVSLVTGDGSLDMPILGARTVDLEDRGTLALILAAFLGFFLFKALFTVGSRHLQHRIAQGIGVRLARRVVDAYLRAPYAFHLNRNSASLIRTAQTSVDETVIRGFIPLVTIATQTLLVAGLVALLVVASPVAALVAAAVIGTTTWLIQRIVRPRLRSHGRTANRMVADTLRWLQQGLGAIRDVIVLGRERYFLDRYSSGRRRLARARYMRATYAAMPNAMLEFAIIGVLVIFMGLAFLTGDNSTAFLPIASLFAYAGFRLKPAVQLITGAANDLQFGAAAIETVHEDLSELEGMSRDRAAVDPFPFQDRIRLDDVAFHYEGGAGDALRGVDLEIRSGTQVGVCGPTGGGKTTLVDLVAGLIDPTSGSVTIDGHDLQEVKSAWQATLGVVPQEVVLIDDTLRRNIALGLSDAEIDEVALRESVQLAQLDEFIDELPDGLNTLVGERGVRLSGGQRQRVAIARALYRRPRVLLFDEGTSALDNVTETQLMKAIEALRGRLTVVIVAHRLSTVENADTIFFVEDGRVSGRGSYDDLLEAHAGFARLINDS